MWILSGDSSTLHFLAIRKTCFCACSGFSRMHQFPLVTFNIWEAIRHWQIKQPMLSPPWGEVSFVMAFFSAWERPIFAGSSITCICRTTEFERQQSWHSNAAPLTSRRDTQQPLLTFFHFLMEDREKVSPPTTGYPVIIFTSPITTCLGTGHSWS